MRAVISLAAAAAVLATAGAAASEENVTLSGNAPAICTLPDTWTFVSGFNGAGGDSFSGSTWRIPTAVLAGPDATPAGSTEYAIRIRGQGVCNVSHNITLTSERGGLTADAAGGNTPAGFGTGATMSYAAQWSEHGLGSSQNGAFGPTASFTPTSAGDSSAPAAYVVSAELPPPGERAFDIRMGLQRPAGSLPLLAGAYSDKLIVTLSTR